MCYSGRIQNGVVVLDNGAELAEGTVVRVEVETTQPAGGQAAQGHPRLMKLAGALKEMPSDLARNHDHYVHGQPKR